MANYCSIYLICKYVQVKTAVVVAFVLEDIKNKYYKRSWTSNEIIQLKIKTYNVELVNLIV